MNPERKPDSPKGDGTPEVVMFLGARGAQRVAEGVAGEQAPLKPMGPTQEKPTSSDK